MTGNLPDERAVTPIRSPCQPSRAEIEEPVDVRNTDGSKPTLKGLAYSALTSSGRTGHPNERRWRCRK